MAVSTIGTAIRSRYSEHVNPQWVRLLDLLEMNVHYQHCSGTELFTDDGRRILDFLSGYSVHNIGHNHPTVIAALREELDRNGPAMIQSHVAERAGELGEKLCERAGGRLTKVFFASSGSEGIEAAIKFARAHTKRAGLLYADGAFHGLTCGALSLMGDPFWREGFGPLLPETEAIPFDDVDALERTLATKRFAAFLVEPIQSEAGVRVPSAEYFPDRSVYMPALRHALCAGRSADWHVSHRTVPCPTALWLGSGHGRIGEGDERWIGSG